MYYPGKKEYKRVAPKGFLVPLSRRLKLKGGVLDTFEKINQGNFSFLLDSARFHRDTGRYSFLGCKPFLIFKSKANHIEIITERERSIYRGNPIHKLREILNSFKSIKIAGLPNFTGGAVGYFGYDVCHFFESLPCLAKDDLNLPDILFMFVDTLIAFDHFNSQVLVISNIKPKGSLNKSYDEAVEKIERLMEGLNSSPGRDNFSYFTEETHLPLNYKVRPEKRIESTFTQEGFEGIVRRAKEYIKAGDIFQANLSQRLSTQTDVEPFRLYRILRKINPSPFACYLNLDELKIVSSSPERLLKLEDRLVQTRPIAGTRPRGKTPNEDMALSSELILNEKERAEHIMLVDLERNDLGRVCEYGTVKVDKLMFLEEYSHVIHIVSNIKGILHRDKDRFDLLRAVFPGGTITGTPKVRCMEIIDELEPVRRNIYTGSIGYLSFNGDLDLNIVIRTFIITNSKAYVQVGAGIVADSDPTKEYYETLYKAQALLETLRRTERCLVA